MAARSKELSSKESKRKVSMKDGAESPSRGWWKIGEACVRPVGMWPEQMEQRASWSTTMTTMSVLMTIEVELPRRVQRDDVSQACPWQATSEVGASSRMERAFLEPSMSQEIVEPVRLGYRLASVRWESRVRGKPLLWKESSREIRVG